MIIFSLSFIFSLPKQQHLQDDMFFFFLLGLVSWRGLDYLFVFLNPIEFYRCRSLVTHSCLCIRYLFVCSNFSFLHNSQRTTFPTQICVPFTPCVLLCWIHLLCVWQFLFFLHMNYTCYFIECHQFSFFFLLLSLLQVFRAIFAGGFCIWSIVADINKALCWIPHQDIYYMLGYSYGLYYLFQSYGYAGHRPAPLCVLLSRRITLCPFFLSILFLVVTRTGFNFSLLGSRTT